MQRSYLDYAMSVIVARALPDVRDGLKPVHRRILHAMREGGYDYNRPTRKSSRIVGDVMGKYHPHGGDAIYDSLVRMAQDFSMRLPLIDGQGNFGSMDGDPPAAMRYTEARLAQAADALLADIDKDTVDFRPNYDDTDREPAVLPAQFPNLLVNGAGGIAVGMATNVPPHNLGEVIDACVALVDDPDLGFERLLELIPGPDFPTGGIILGQAGIRQAFATGRGSLVVRSKTHIEEVRKDRDAIVVTEIPYQVNKGRMQERMGELVRERKLEGIAEIRDESDRDGTRVVIEIKRDADPDIVLNQLFRHTPLQVTFGVNLVALSGGRPAQMNVRQVLELFLEFREEVIARRTAFDLARARERAHVLLGLAVAVANLDAIIALIRAAPDPASAREQLAAQDWPLGDVAPLLHLAEESVTDTPAGPDDTYRLSERQAQAILELRLHRLTQLERSKITDELKEISERIRELLHILRSRERLLEVLKEELLSVRERFATPRRTTIEDLDYEVDIEDLIQKEDMVVTVTRLGYIKRTPLSTYREQRRGGKGRVGMATHEDDFLAQLFVANTHTPVLFFSSAGRVYKLKVYRLPQGTPQARGKAMINLFPQLTEGETITAVLPLPEDETTYDQLSVVFATASGKVRRNALADFIFVPANGKIAMGLDEGDHLVGVAVATGHERRPAGGARRQVRALPDRQRARVPLAQLRGRARHGSGRGRPGRVDVGARSRRAVDRGARHVPALRCGAAQAGRPGRDGRSGRADGAARGDHPRRARGAGCQPPGRARRRAADDPVAHRERLRQAHLRVRVPRHQSRRPGHHQHRDQQAQRPGGRGLPGRRRGPADAGDRRRPGDPHPGRRHPHREPQHPGRAAVRRRRRRACGVGGAARRRGRGQRRGA